MSLHLVLFLIASHIVVCHASDRCSTNSIGPNMTSTAAVGFLPKNAGSRRERVIVSANEMNTQIFYVPPHKLSQFLEETSSLFGYSRFISYLLNSICFT